MAVVASCTTTLLVARYLAASAATAAAEAGNARAESNLHHVGHSSATTAATPQENSAFHLHLCLTLLLCSSPPLSLFHLLPPPVLVKEIADVAASSRFATSKYPVTISLWPSLYAAMASSRCCCCWVLLLPPAAAAAAPAFASSPLRTCVASYTR